MSPRPTTVARSAGFTLLEVLVVLAVLAVILVVSFELRPRQERTFAGSVSQLVREARFIAIRESTPVLVRWHEPSGEFQVLESPAGSCDALGGVVRSPLLVPSGVRVESEDFPGVVWRPNGIPRACPPHSTLAGRSLSFLGPRGEARLVFSSLGDGEVQ